MRSTLISGIFGKKGRWGIDTPSQPTSKDTMQEKVSEGLQMNQAREMAMLAEEVQQRKAVEAELYANKVMPKIMKVFDAEINKAARNGRSVINISWQLVTPEFNHPAMYVIIPRVVAELKANGFQAATYSQYGGSGVQVSW